MARNESVWRKLSRSAGQLLLLAGLLAGAQAKDTVTWGMLNIPPLWIREGPDKGQGIQDQFVHYLENRLSGYAHDEVTAPIARVSMEIKEGHHWCTQFIMKPEREAWAYFSLPALMVLPNGVVTRKDKLSRFDRFGTPLLLESLLADPSLRLSAERERAYAPLIDSALKQHPPTSFHIDTPHAVGMLMLDRIDYLIESPVVATYTADQLNVRGSVITLPISEGGAPYLVRIACPKNAWGKQVIDEVNAVLRVERTKPEYRRIMEMWHDEDGVREIRRNYDTLFLKSE